MVGKARKRGVGQRRAARAQKKEEEEEEEGEQGPPPSPGDPRYFQDQVDAFHEARSQAALAPSWSDGESGAEDPEEEEEVLGLDVPEEEEEEEEEEDDAGSVGGSSVLSEAEAADADPSLSWGRRKKLYYDTDYRAAKGKGQQSQQEAEEEEREEEEEAQVIQRRLAQALHEDDFGLSWVQAFGQAAQPRAEEPRTRVVTDLQRVPAKEKLKLLRRESPELLELIEDLKAKLTELKDELEPLLRLAEAGAVPPGKGRRYLQTKYSLYLHYCFNVSFYLVLKARRAPVHGHPVIERLVTYRSLINKLAPVDRRLAGEVRRLLSRGAAGGRVTADPKRKPPSKTPAGSAALGPADDSEEDEEAARKHYREMEERLNLKRKKEEAAEEEEGEAPGDPSAKRAITYQIAKNKGLTPRRKKIDRNPRVKHREKFRRAKIRRRGQVPQVRTEEYKYAGELSGIRAGVKKSIKLK
ncbi:something about silencing protein 10 [Vombatus ursinus]|uniref:UTP3 small subunit processome component n=1 Tax=Vombatus ursinus TaxID=29139 RepID=A0A4X2KP02_VOMUR|nr:something about silencing protein 10 [Vombatus ursinus]